MKRLIHFLMIAMVLIVNHKLSYTQSSISFYQEFNGGVDMITTAGTFRDKDNATNSDASSLRQIAYGDLTIPTGAQVEAAYLYWAGSGEMADNNVNFDGSNVSATRFFADNRMDPDFDINYFGGFADITTIVQSQPAGTTKTYEMKSLNVDDGGNYFIFQGTVAVWSMIVIYRSPSITENYKIVLYDGLEIFYDASINVNNSGAYMLDGFNIGTAGDGEIASMIYEGDLNLQDNESISLNGNNLLPFGNTHDQSSNVPGVGGAFPSYGLDIDEFDISSFINPGDNSVNFGVSTGGDLVIVNALAVRMNYIPLIDSDGDGLPDITDLDDDDDGIYDTQEICGTDPLDLIFTRDIEITIDLDEWENETSWELVFNGFIVASGNSYEATDDIITRTITVDDAGTYVFTIADSYGDGLNANGGSDENGQSSYRIDVDGVNVFLSNPSPNFGTSSSHDINIGFMTNPFDCLSDDPSGDADLDGIPNYQDPDYCVLNANGVCDSMDLDGDGLPNYLDTDSDDDGCSDSNEAYQDENADGGDNENYGIGDPPPTDPANGTVIAADYTGLDPSYLDGTVSTICFECAVIYTNRFIRYNNAGTKD